MGTPARVLRVIGIAVGIAVATIVIFLAGSIVFFRIGRSADFADQRRRLAALALRDASASGSLSADLRVPDGTPLDRLRVIGTHNSYRKKADVLRMFFVGLAQPGEPDRLNYAHPSLTAQFDSGIRSLELDVRYRAGRFETTHVPLVDDRSTVPDFQLALREVAAWSEKNQGHVPITLLLELKGDYAFLDPALKPIREPQLDSLDALIRAELGGRLFTPDEVRGNAVTLAGAIAAKGWPTLATLRGRVMVILHENEGYRQTYVTGHPSLAGRAMFTCAPRGAPDAGVAVINDPVIDAARIAEALAHRSLVRTRADGDGVHGPKGLGAALASGAQIVSTDFPPAYPAPDGYQASFGQGRLVEVRAP